MPTLFSIRDWNKDFETAGTRKLKSLSWVKFSNEHDKIKWRRMVQADRTGSVFGCFAAAAEVASKMPERGVLANSDGPLTPSDLELATGLSAESMVNMLSILSDPQLKIGWIVATETEGKSANVRQRPPTHPR